MTNTEKMNRINLWFMGAGPPPMEDLAEFIQKEAYINKYSFPFYNRFDSLFTKLGLTKPNS